jgi:hypothetical protein
VYTTRSPPVTEYQMKIVAEVTGCLADEGAAEADTILADAVPGLTPGQTRALARRVVLMIDPEAAQERKRDAARRARVEKFQEDSGTAALCGRDLPPDAVLAGYQHIDSRARAMKAAGHAEGLERLRAAVYLALLTGRDPQDMLAALQAAAGDPPATGPVSTDAGRTGRWPRTQPHELRTQPHELRTQPHELENHQDQASGGQNGEDENGSGRGGIRKPQGPGGPQGPGCGHGTGGSGAAPFAAVINLQVPARTLFETGTAPGEIPGFGPVDPQTTRDLVQIASAHPATRWCVTAIGPDGTAREHGCVPGRHRWTPATTRTGGGNRDGPARPPDRVAAPGDEEGKSAAHGFLARLQVKLAPVAIGTQGCDHSHCTDRYVVPDKLKHLVQARKATCVAPCCNWPAADGDADHTVPWPDGPTCQENLGAPRVR